MNDVAFNNFILDTIRPMGAKGDWDYRISDLVKNLDGIDRPI